MDTIKDIIDDAIASEEVQREIIPELQRVLAHFGPENQVSDVQECIRCICIGLATPLHIRDSCVTSEALILELRRMIVDESHRIREIFMQMEESPDQNIDELADSVVRSIENWQWSRELN